MEHAPFTMFVTRGMGGVIYSAKLALLSASGGLLYNSFQLIAVVLMPGSTPFPPIGGKGWGWVEISA
jgi:hypothetical protein